MHKLKWIYHDSHILTDKIVHLGLAVDVQLEVQQSHSDLGLQKLVMLL